MLTHDHQPVFLADYQKPPYRIGEAGLVFELDDDCTLVSSRLHIYAEHGQSENPPDLELDGQGIVPQKLTINGIRLEEDQYTLQDEKLIIYSPPNEFILGQQNRVFPSKNTALEGLYKSGSKLCTQCEAEGFRRITWFIDRPDVLTTFMVTIIGDKNRYPVMLANGNLVVKGEMEDGRHFTRWHDPFPKPSYLFALVAGDLALVEDSYITMTGREVALQFYVEQHNRDRCGHAVESLKKAFKWDEDTYGLEYDLDQYMVVAVDDFNMGAMENKGLNVFNSKYVLASTETATDNDYEGIEAVIAHEYFHNWTGNRVTCRDWFQLSLKEGLTVFRDQEFSADMTSRPVKRISDVQMLRGRQFPEDSGPMAHAVRTGSYIEINNFYTLTVYEKGAELVRMVHTLIGPEKFKKGLRLYLERHDGHAATVEDFVSAMAEAAGRDLEHFMLWYDQAGTPRLEVTGEHDPEAATFVLTIRQWCPPTPGQPDKKPLHIPIQIGLIDQQGRALPLTIEGNDSADGTILLELHSEEERFTFTGITDRPVPSLLRGFTAPVIVNYDYSDDDLALLLSFDSDSFSKWDAGQQLVVRKLLDTIGEIKAGRNVVIPDKTLEPFGFLFSEKFQENPAFLSKLLTLPSEEYLAEQMGVVDVDAIHSAWKTFHRSLALKYRKQFERIYNENDVREPYRYDPQSAGKRQLKNTSLSYLVTIGEEFAGLCHDQYYRADNMTDRLVALRLAVHNDLDIAENLLQAFENDWSHEVLVMDKWLSIQATAPLPGSLERVKTLTSHHTFTIKNPNRVRALLGAFAMSNPVCFNEADGSGYKFMATKIKELDEINPQIAARMSGSFGRMKKFDQERQSLMKEQLERIRSGENISKDLHEVISKILDN